jgi:hypothetical protein
VAAPCAWRTTLAMRSSKGGRTPATANACMQVSMHVCVPVCMVCVCVCACVCMRVRVYDSGERVEVTEVDRGTRASKAARRAHVYVCAAVGTSGGTSHSARAHARTLALTHRLS